jgi:DNA-directed RNA polymerase I subunit RPA1
MIQMHAATCGVDDLLLMSKKDYEREKNLQDCEKVGEDVHLLFVNGKGGDEIGMLLFV